MTHDETSLYHFAILGVMCDVQSEEWVKVFETYQR